MLFLPLYYLFLLVQGSFIGMAFWTNVLESTADTNASIAFALFFFLILNIKWRFEINLFNFPLIVLLLVNVNSLI